MPRELFTTNLCVTHYTSVPTKNHQSTVYKFCVRSDISHEWVNGFGSHIHT